MRNKFSIGFDDFSPRSGTNDLTWCNRLIDSHPDIKIDLFVPAAFARPGDRKPYFLRDHADWVNQVSKLPKNYKINLHSYHHRRSKNDFKWHRGPPSANNEWENISYDEAKKLLDLIEHEFKIVGLEHSKTFRPAGWHIGTQAVKLLSDRGYTIAGDNRYFKKNKGKIQNMRWVQYNWDLIGPAPTGTDIIAYGHSSTWNKNYINEANYNVIMNVLKREDFEFAFIEDIVK